MPGAGAPRGQGQPAAGMGTLGRPWVLLFTYVLTTLELTCLFMQFSILPYLSRLLGLDSITFGYLQTTFGVLQLLGGPVFGRFADQRGARAAFTICSLAASALYLLLAASCSPALPGVALLFASRLPAALMHTMPTAQMVITDLSTPEERPTALSRLGLCFGVGTILGSLLGGTLSTAYGIQCPAIIAFLLNLLGAILSFTCIPVSTKRASAHGQADPPGKRKASVFDLKAIAHLLLQPGVLPVFLVKVISGFPSDHPGPSHWAAEQALLGGRAAPGQRAGLLHGGTRHGIHVQCPPLLPPDARTHIQPVYPQRGHGQHSNQGRLGLGHRDHAGPLRLCAAADPHRGAHPRRPPVSQLRCPCLWPCAVCRQLPRPPGPLEAASAPEEEQSPVTLAPGHRLPINSLGTSSGLISASSHGAYLRLVGQEAWG
ncbi:solute carrier family 22 member 18 isoform X2 [Rhinolophus sinicus]|uniref:solute carrier family 22 member 18 isoform X2 n=1 Tax=Rhinolophus sinicus TaxID=89399 RepID=UPI003D7A05F3